MLGITPVPRKKPGAFAALICFCFFQGGFSPVHAGGKAEEAAKDPLNKEWVFCITAFDVSELPPSRQVMGEVMSARLVEAFNIVERRVRVSPEYAYYEGAAMTRARLDAGRKLAAKHDERDQLLFKGDPDWKYRRSLAVIDRDIRSLEETYQKAEANVPAIEAEPVFTLASGNLEGLFPETPSAGGEYRFCTSQRTDAFLAAKASEFHGRIYLVLRIYALYTRSYQYEDSIIFSPEDIGSAMDELAGRLTAEVAGTLPAAILVHTEPKEALVLINRNFAGRGDTGVMERSPGTVEVSVVAENHSSIAMPLDLSSGEISELFIYLSPLTMRAFMVDVPLRPGSAVYRGGLYLGQTPLSLDLPLDQVEAISVETPDGERGAVVVQGETAGAVVSPPVYLPKTEKEVDPSRRGFYGAYGRFWIALPVAYLIYGLSSFYIETYNRPESPGSPELYNQATTLYYINLGTIIVAGGFLAESLARMGYYIYTSSKHQTTIAK